MAKIIPVLNNKFEIISFCNTNNYQVIFSLFPKSSIVGKALNILIVFLAER